MLKPWQSTGDHKTLTLKVAEDPAEVDQVTQSSSRGQKNYFVSHTGKFLSLMRRKSRKIVESLSRSAGGRWVGNYKPAGLPLIGYLICWRNQRQCSFFKKTFEIYFMIWLIQKTSAPSDDNNPADLRDYQETGVKWFSMLNHYGFGGIFSGWYGAWGKPTNYFPSWPVST